MVNFGDLRIDNLIYYNGEVVPVYHLDKAAAYIESKKIKTLPRIGKRRIIWMN
jgi:hypothetical protein